MTRKSDIKLTVKTRRVRYRARLKERATHATMRDSMPYCIMQTSRSEIISAKIAAWSTMTLNSSSDIIWTWRSTAVAARVPAAVTAAQRARALTTRFVARAAGGARAK